MNKLKYNLEKLGYKTYSEYLKSEHWQDVRKRFYASKLFKGCCFCCEKKNCLFHLHHKTYKRLGAEYLMDVIAVCASCHEDIHILLKTTTNTRINLWNSCKKIRNQKYREKKNLNKIGFSELRTRNKLVNNYSQRLGKRL